jgi:hypothetical protein
VDEVDKEWFCRNCRVDVVVPDPVPVPVQVSIPDIDPAGLVSVEGATLEQVSGLVLLFIALASPNVSHRGNDISPLCLQMCLSAF